MGVFGNAWTPSFFVIMRWLNNFKVQAPETVCS